MAFNLPQRDLFSAVAEQMAENKFIISPYANAMIHSRFNGLGLPQGQSYVFFTRFSGADPMPERFAALSVSREEGLPTARSRVYYGWWNAGKGRWAVTDGLSLNRILPEAVENLGSQVKDYQSGKPVHITL